MSRDLNFLHEYVAGGLPFNGQVRRNGSAITGYLLVPTLQGMGTNSGASAEVENKIKHNIVGKSLSMCVGVPKLQFYIVVTG